MSEVKPAPVEIVSPTPVPVEIVGAVPVPVPVHVEIKAPSVTTPEEDRTTQSQRETSWMWEDTQRKAALIVIWCSILVASCVVVFGKWLGSTDLQLASGVFLYGVANLVIGFYFGRTNHTRVGGVGGDSSAKVR